MKFAKMQGTGNDFFIVESQGEERDWGALAVAMCERHFGAGADGLMLLLPSQRADVRMRLFNADGSEAEVSGNGVRCLVKYAVERGLAQPTDGRVTIEAVHALLDAEVQSEGAQVASVRLSMGPPRFAPEEVPVLVPVGAQGPILDYPIDVEGRRLFVNCLSMGNPHAVLIDSDPVERFPLEALGPLVEHHSLFPERVNFGVAWVTGRDSMDVRVWERGAGETLACGSGCCAAMVTARLKGLVGDRVEIQQPGGRLTVEWDGSGDVYLSGGAEFVYEGEWPEGG